MYKEITDQKIVEEQKRLFHKLDPILFEIRSLRTIIQNPVMLEKDDVTEFFATGIGVSKELLDYICEVQIFVNENMIEGDSNEN